MKTPLRKPFGPRISAFFRPSTLGLRNSFSFGLRTLLLCLAVPACHSPSSLRGGRALTTPTPAGLQQSVTQSDNPSAPTRQDQSTIRIRTYTLPAGSRIEHPSLQTANIRPIPSYPSHSAIYSPSPLWGEGRPARRSAFDEGGGEVFHAPALQHSTAPPATVVLAAPTPVIERDETRATTELGAAQKDTARELGTRLSSLRGIVWVGIGLFMFGLVSLAWPPLRALIGSVTTSAAITLGGVALMILPTLIVGHELLILAGVTLLVLAWFLAHRHGHLRGLVNSTAPIRAPQSEPRPQPLTPKSLSSSSSSSS